MSAPLPILTRLAKAHFNPSEKRDPHSGKWLGDGVPGKHPEVQALADRLHSLHSTRDSAVQLPNGTSIAASRSADGASKMVDIRHNNGTRESYYIDDASGRTKAADHALAGDNRGAGGPGRTRVVGDAPTRPPKVIGDGPPSARDTEIADDIRRRHAEGGGKPITATDKQIAATARASGWKLP